MKADDRLHGLDAVRGFALLAGVVLHATVSFISGIGAMGWPIVDNSPSVAMGLTFYVIHIFRMTAFFLVAGFFGRLLLQRDGVRGFVRNRFRRIVIPLVVFWIVLMPLLIGAVAWGAYKTNGSATPLLLPRPADPLWFPLAHLWFLYVLTWLYAAVLALRGVVDWIDAAGRLRAFIDHCVELVCTRRWGFLLLAAPLALVLATREDWVAWFGIPTPDQRLVPNLPATTAFGIAFGFGWLVHRQQHLLRIWERRWAFHGIVAVALTVACLSLQGLTPTYTPAPRSPSTTVYAVCYGVAVWAWALALLGGGLRLFVQASTARRYVADSSYWIYLMHLPVVFYLQVAMQGLPLHWSIKFSFVLTVALAVLFASYHYLVRPTFIGTLLNGRRVIPLRKPAAGR